VTAVESGRAALLALGENPQRYSLILTDVAMPDVHGLDVLRYVRSQPALHALPVVMMSAHENAGTGAWRGARATACATDRQAPARAVSRGSRVLRGVARKQAWRARPAAMRGAPPRRPAAWRHPLGDASSGVGAAGVCALLVARRATRAPPD
jgi:CheY-like chemotaxis protein